MPVIHEGWYPAPVQLRLNLLWAVNAEGAPLDIDLSLLMLGADGKLPDNDHFIFYNNLRSPDGSAVLADEISLPGKNSIKDLTLDLSKVDLLVTKIVVVATIHHAEQNRHSFGTSQAARLSVESLSDRETLLCFDLNGDFHAESSLELMNLQRKGDGWEWKSLGTPSAGGLSGFITRFQ